MGELIQVKSRTVTRPATVHTRARQTGTEGQGPQTLVPLDSAGKLVLCQHGAWALLDRSMESGMRQTGQTTGEPHQGFRRTAPRAQTPSPDSGKHALRSACPFSQSYFSKSWEAWGTAGLGDLGGRHRQWYQEGTIEQREVAGLSHALGGWRETTGRGTDYRQGLIEATQQTSLTISLFIR